MPEFISSSKDKPLNHPSKPETKYHPGQQQKTDKNGLNNSQSQRNNYKYKTNRNRSSNPRRRQDWQHRQKPSSKPPSFLTRLLNRIKVFLGLQPKPSKKRRPNRNTARNFSKNSNRQGRNTYGRTNTKYSKSFPARDDRKENSGHYNNAQKNRGQSFKKKNQPLDTAKAPQRSSSENSSFNNPKPRSSNESSD